MTRLNLLSPAGWRDLGWSNSEYRRIRKCKRLRCC